MSSESISSLNNFSNPIPFTTHKNILLKKSIASISLIIGVTLNILGVLIITLSIIPDHLTHIIGFSFIAVGIIIIMISIFVLAIQNSKSKLNQYRQDVELKLDHCKQTIDSIISKYQSENMYIENKKIKQDIANLKQLKQNDDKALQELILKDMIQQEQIIALNKENELLTKQINKVNKNLS